MRVQHPEKRQHHVEPVDFPFFTTDEKGVSPDIHDDLAARLVEQGWTEVKSTKKEG